MSFDLTGMERQNWVEAIVTIAVALVAHIHTEYTERREGVRVEEKAQKMECHDEGEFRGL